jgi:hypothetical protein
MRSGAGGAAAAPLAGFLSSRLPERMLMFLVAGIVISLSILGLARLVV